MSEVGNADVVVTRVSVMRREKRSEERGLSRKFSSRIGFQNFRSRSEK